MTRTKQRRPLLREAKTVYRPDRAEERQDDKQK
jgi:hypothetical protein